MIFSNFEIMPKIGFGVVVSLLFFSYNCFSANDVAVNFSGNVIAAPCTLSGDSVMSVNLGDVTAAVLATKGNGSEFKTFSISFINCPASTTKIVAKFSGTTDSTNSIYYANTGTAKNVALDVNLNGTAYRPNNGNTLTADIDSSTRTASFPFQARMVSTGSDSATTGTFSAQMLATITYQ